MQADLVAGVALTPVGLIALKEVRCWREIAFASLPLLFALHQFIEAFVWAADDGDVSKSLGHAAAVAYVIFALPVLPTLFPLAVLLLEPQKSRLRVVPFLAIGLVTSAYLGYALMVKPITVTVHAHALSYETGVTNGTFWAVLYVVAVVGPSLLSGYRSIVAFGLFNLLGLIAVSLLYVEAFDSLWCILAGISSVLVLRHMLLRRTLPDADRIHGIRTPIPQMPGAFHTC